MAPQELLDSIEQAESERLAELVDTLTEALRRMRDWCLDGDEPSAPDGTGDLLVYVNRLIEGQES